MFAGWLNDRFRNAEWDTVRRQDVLTWLSWLCFKQTAEIAIADREKAAFLLEALGKVEEYTDTKFEDCIGLETGIEVMRIEHDPVKVIQHALCCRN